MEIENQATNFRKDLIRDNIQKWRRIFKKILKPIIDNWFENNLHLVG